ncbi:MAG: ATP-binding cassette domain-containing protein [Candidatus Thermoplasmatota archaeon]|nr:ATP-binding cassette domain-containing protein [Candidatus Thermoplasmatota archaeon]
MATTGAGDVVVHLDGVTIGYDKNKPLAEIPSLKIKNGEILAIAGPSGIGKSTLVKTIAGLVRPLTGDIEVCGVMAPRRPVRGELGYIPQRLGLIRHATVFHNVLIGSRARFCGPFDIFASKQAKEWAKKAIAKMGLEHKTWEPIKRLSGGQQRRVATARTLAQRPRLILADE